MPRDQSDRADPQRQRLGTRIRDLRDQALITQEVFAEMANINRRTLQRIEAGTSDPRYSDLVHIATALGITVADLVGE